jgi:hypothetical protein
MIKASSAGNDVTFTWYTSDGSKIKGVEGSTFETTPVEVETFVYVSGNSADGCQGPKHLVTVTPVELSNPIIRIENDTLRTDAIANSYIWSLNGTEVRTTDKPFLPVRSTGEYTVKCVMGTCTATSASFRVTELESGYANEDIMLYPNPTISDNINLKGDMDPGTTVEIKVIDVAGRVLYQGNAEGSELSGGVKVRPQTRLEPGIYFLILEENSKNRKIKFLIKE